MSRFDGRELMDSLTPSRTPAAAGARFVRESGYDGCVELSNGTVRVVLEPNAGGRVLSYARAGLEALWRDPSQDGFVWDGKTRVPLCAGRLDIGPEYGGVPHDPWWFGRWTAKITGPRSARLTSQALAGRDFQLVREFVLDDASSHLRCTQRMCNRGPAPWRTFHWSRTLAVGGGIVIAPLPTAGRFPRGYSLGGPAGSIDFMPPPETNVRIREQMLEITGAPTKPKFNFDVGAGWLGYLLPAGMFFLKTFSVYPDRPYGELAANNASIWYRTHQNAPTWDGRADVVEIEPIGPLEVIEAGGERSFTEDWWLEPFAFPADRQADLSRVRALAAAATSWSTHREAGP